MIYFERAHTKFSDALNKHVDELRDIIWGKVQVYKGGRYNNLLNPLAIDVILRMEPRKLYQVNIFFYKCLNSNFKLKDFEYYLMLGENKKDPIKDSFNVIKEDLDKLFDYKSFCNKRKNYSAYNLAEKLDIPTCTYCNRMYTKTVVIRKKQKITRPAFDHWYPKSKFPLLQLSFFNLIPSCTICNSGAKGSGVFKLNEIFHPYSKKRDLGYKFSYYNKTLNSYGFSIKTEDSFWKESVKAFYLEEIYKTHEDEISDLRKIKDSYSPAYIANLKTIFSNSKTPLSDSEIYRLAFGVHLEEDKFDRRPLSKMKKDILKELGIIT